MKKKTVTKKVAKKVAVEIDGATYNEFGTCIECQGGDTACHHNNLAQTAEGVFCMTCGIKVQ